MICSAPLTVVIHFLKRQDISREFPQKQKQIQKQNVLQEPASLRRVQDEISSYFSLKIFNLK